KTTLLRCIAGLIRPTAGLISVDGISMLDDPDEGRHRMGMVFQSAALFDFLSVKDNVLFGPRRWFNLSRQEQDELLKLSLDRVGLAGSEHLMPSELSGGMRKRVGMARALALKPKVILYDEPTTGLDPVTTYSIDQLIVSLQRTLQVTSLVVSHDLLSVSRIADRVGFLHQGSLVFVGTPEEFVADKHEAIRELVDKSRANELLPIE
ncbi:MAG TPA: ATP-binding cassette domain-containing protein, partial [Fimbriimonadaceae bacterium]|nr:ATP-binding cassette domain-containing protein [Fimbriimonadaceae bacterium]